MEYLYKEYYKHDHKKYHDIYLSRFTSDSAYQTGLMIRGKHSEEFFQLYYVYQQSTLSYIEQIRKNDIRLQELDRKLPSTAKKAFLIEVISSELFSTNEIEGIVSSKEEIIETTRQSLEQKDTSQSRFHSMIESYLSLGSKQEAIPPVSNEDIRKIYDEITDGEIEQANLPDGKFYRKENVYLQKKGSVAQEYIHEGIYGESNIEAEMMKLLAFMSHSEISLLLRVAIGHYYFGYIHPFYDGNGRTGRFLSSLYLRQEYSFFTAMALARGIFLNKNEYYRMFERTNHKISRGEMNYFVDTLLSMLMKGQEDILENLTQKEELLSNALRKIEQDIRIQDACKQEILFLMTQGFYFEQDKHFPRKTLFDILNNASYSTNKIKQSLRELEQDNFIQKTSYRPVKYQFTEETIRMITTES